MSTASKLSVDEPKHACRWKFFQKLGVWTIDCRNNRAPQRIRYTGVNDFNYCPYCGKKILLSSKELTGE